MKFKLTSNYKPTGDQPTAIAQLKAGIERDDPFQTLLGVTGSGKTFTVANVIQEVQRPTLVLSHNKTLAAQLYGEFQQFFPDNAVEYFVSYYDYYQPEAYLPVTDTYIEKDLSINEEIEKLRLSTTSSLLSGRRDIIVVSSVSCLYGIGNPQDFFSNSIELKQGDMIGRDTFLRRLVDALYSRNDVEFKRGTFRVRGETVDIFLAYDDIAYRIVFWDDEIETLESIDPGTGDTLQQFENILIYPSSIFVTTRDRINQAIKQIQDDLYERLQVFRDEGKEHEAKRLEERVSFDLEMIKELGYCSGIENYSRYFDGRDPGTRPFCLLDYFPEDYITVIDESHVTIPQIKAMYGGDFSRKRTLVEHGFRLPAAIDNRPLKFEEFESLVSQTLFVSATPSDYEINLCEGVVVDQVIRPTGLLDPVIEVRPSLNQIDNLLKEIRIRTEKKERVLVTTLTKRMAEELTDYLLKFNVRCRYIHSSIDTLERVDIIDQLRDGTFDVLVGVNLLREGLDLPEVSLVAILDADKEGFLRSEKALTQTAGRAARHLNGMVIMYADKITNSMQNTIDETNRRRAKQLEYNKKNNISPTPIQRSTRPTMTQSGKKEKEKQTPKYYSGEQAPDIAADPVIEYMDEKKLKKAIGEAKRKMEAASKELDFIQAAKYRDEMYTLEKKLKNKTN